MREINFDTIVSLVAQMCIQVNCLIGDDIKQALQEAKKNEKSSLAFDVLDKILANAEVAREKMIPTCQDTGLTVVFVEIGQEVHIKGGSLEEAINKGVAQGYQEGFLRKSIVADPIRRVNTGDNTPAVIHYQMASGDNLKRVMTSTESNKKLYC